MKHGCDWETVTDEAREEAVEKFSHSAPFQSGASGNSELSALLRQNRELALQNRQLTVEIQSLRRRDELMNSLLVETRNLLRCHRFVDSAKRLFRACCEATGAVSGYVALLSADGRENEVLFLESGGLPCHVDPTLPMPVRGMRADAYARGRALYENRFMDSEWVKFMPEGHVTLRNVMFAPLMIDGSAVGVIGLANKDGDFSDEDAAAAEAYADLAALALQRIQAEEKLTETEQALRATVENIPAHIALLDENGRVLLANNSWSRFAPGTGAIPAPCPGGDYFRGGCEVEPEKHPPETDPFAVGVRRVLAGETGSFELEYQCLAEGVERWFAGRVAPVAGPGPRRAVTVHTDITERKTAELRMREKNRQLTDILESISEGFFAFDERLVFTHYNSAAAKLLGKPAEEVLGLEFLKAFPVARGSIFDLKYRQALKEQQPLNFDSYFNIPPYENWYDVRVYPNNGGITVFFQVVTARKEAEKALRESENRYRELADSITDIYFAMDQDLRYTYWNRATCEFMGYSASEAIGRTPVDFFPDNEYLRELIVRFHDVLRTHQPSHFVLRFPVKDKEYWFDMSLYPAQAGLVAHCRDITGRVRAEEALRLSEEKFSRAFFTSPYAITITRIADGVFMDTNEGFCAISGYSREEVMSKSSTQLNIWENIDDRRRVATDLLEGRSVQGREYRFRCKDGRIITGLLSAQLMKLGTEMCILASINDITDRKRMEEELRDNAARLRGYIENAPTGVFIANETGGYLDVNPMACKITGYSREELLNMSIPDILPPDALEAGLKSFLETVETGVSSVETPFLHKNGNIRYWKVDAIRLSRTRLMGFTADVTDRKLAEEQIREALAEKETLLRELYHRTKNNMMVIHSMINLRESRCNSDETREILKDLQGKLQSMALVHQKLYQSRNVSNVDLYDYIPDLAELLIKNYSQVSGTVRLALDLQHVTVLLDVAIPCGLVLSELMSNAFKHAFADGREGTISIRLVRDGEGDILLTFADDGPGVADNFNFRAQPSLGLKTLFAIVEHQLRGKIEFEDRGGLECRIRFRDNLYSARV